MVSIRQSQQPDFDLENRFLATRQDGAFQMACLLSPSLCHSAVRPPPPPRYFTSSLLCTPFFYKAVHHSVSDTYDRPTLFYHVSSLLTFCCFCFAGLNKVDAEVFSAYECRSLPPELGNTHPGDISEPGLLAAVSLPPPTYGSEAFHGAVIDDTKLSRLQLEGVRW